MGSSGLKTSGRNPDKILMSDSPREAGENRELSPLSRVPMESESMMNSPKHSSPKSPLRESIRSPLRESISSLSGTNMEQMDRVLEMMGNSPVLGAFDGLDEWDMSNGKKSKSGFLRREEYR